MDLDKLATTIGSIAGSLIAVSQTLPEGNLKKYLGAAGGISVLILGVITNKGQKEIAAKADAAQDKANLVEAKVNEQAK